MLSTTYTITDLKALLKNNYSFYEYSSDLLFIAALESAVEMAMLSEIYPIIGETVYGTIQDLDRTNLTTAQTYLYKAELFFSAARFLLNEDLSRSQNIASTQYSHSVGDVSESISGVSTWRAAAGRFRNDGRLMLSYAGYTPFQIQRTGYFTKRPAVINAS